MPKHLQSEIRSWADRFRRGELTVEDVQERFATISETELQNLAADLRAGVIQARQELDAIRYGMCEAGQRGELERIFRELERLAGSERFHGA